MTGRSPARLLAPLALAAAAVALFAVVSSPKEADSPASGAGERQAATATPSTTKRKASSSAGSSRGATYTVKRGDTPSAIAEREDVDLSALLEANPDADPAALTPGQKLELP